MISYVKDDGLRRLAFSEADLQGVATAGGEGPGGRAGNDGPRQSREHVLHEQCAAGPGQHQRTTQLLPPYVCRCAECGFWRFLK